LHSEICSFCQGDFCITLIDGQITAEAGLCVVIPCSFTISYWFSLKGLVWFKCETVQRCGDSDVILSRNNQKIQPGFKGRVSLLEPNLSQRNCSIIINDLTASDSGSYQLKVNLFTSRGGQDKFQYLQRATVLVKGMEDLTQKPTLMIPPLTEGLQSTLTCTAPGLCSGSAPEITWIHSSTLSFTPSAKHHGTNITCKVGFTGGTTAEETVTLNVTCEYFVYFFLGFAHEDFPGSNPSWKNHLCGVCLFSLCILKSLSLSVELSRVDCLSQS
uniref:Ig-like domain-containing protein n=1 Tax=Labrus bergylta TaxID=56723 RepID=A0A3Q3GLY1_9LABR